MPVHKDCILTYLNIVVVVVIIEICAIYFMFYCKYMYIWKKDIGQRYYYLIVLYYFILLTEIELFLYRETN